MAVNWYTPAEVADWFGAPLPTVYRWIRGGHLPSRRKGRHLWIHADHIKAYKPPVGERIRPAVEGESPRAGQVWGAAAAARARVRNREEYLAREWAAMQPTIDP